MRAIYVQDQRDRGVRLADDGSDLKPDGAAKQSDELSWDQIAKRDEERRTQVRSMLTDGKLLTAQDFRDASFIFQHSQLADDYLLAHVFAVEAILRGDESAKWISAATLDRYLQTIGQKQIYGTQFGDTKYAYYLEHKNDADVLEKYKSIPSAETQQPYNEKLLPSFVRKDFCVPEFTDQHKYVEDHNAGKAVDLPRVQNCKR